MKRLFEGGYTVVEVMIFMTISTAIALSAITLVTGQQEKNRFSTAVRDVESKVTDIINDVDVGYSPNTGSLRCSAGLGVPTITAISGVEQGANQGCIFMGKGMRMSGVAGPATTLDIYSVVGLRQTGLPARDVKTVSEARPVVSTVLREQYVLPNGIQISDIRFPASGEIPRRDVAVISNPQAGGSSRSAVAVPTAELTGSGSTVLDDSSIGRANNGMVICLRFGNGGRVAAIAVGTQLLPGGGGIVPNGQTSSAHAYYDADATSFGCTS